jgi:hypothetical protein
MDAKWTEVVNLSATPDGLASKAPNQDFLPKDQLFSLCTEQWEVPHTPCVHTSQRASRENGQIRQDQE